MEIKKLLKKASPVVGGGVRSSVAVLVYRYVP